MTFPSKVYRVQYPIIWVDCWPWPVTLVVSILSRTSCHTSSLLLTDLRPVLTLPAWWIIVVCLVAWIHQLGTLNISKWCVWRAQAWRSYTYTGNAPYCVTFSAIVYACECFWLPVPVPFKFCTLICLYLDQQSNSFNCVAPVWHCDYLFF